MPNVDIKAARMNFNSPSIACVCALFLSAFVLSGCAYSPAGHEAGVGKRPENVADFGDIRVRMSKVMTLRSKPIPTTYAFLFSWTPEAYNGRNKALGRRAPTQADWDRKKALAIAAGMRPDAVPRIIRYEQRLVARSKFNAYVAPDGTIVRCNDTYGGKYGCTVGLTVSRAKKIELAKQVLSRSKRNCKIDTIDPKGLSALKPNIRSGKLSLVVSLACA